MTKKQRAALIQKELEKLYPANATHLRLFTSTEAKNESMALQEWIEKVK